MSRSVYTFFLALLSVCLSAQDAAPIPILLSQTSLGRDLPYGIRNRIDRQLLSALDIGEGINHKFSIFVIQPALDILEQGKIEGLKTQITVKLNLQLKLTNMMSGEVLDAQDIKASGAGNTLDEAVTRTIVSFRRDNPVLSKSIKTFRQRISEHYLAHCSRVMTMANELAGQKKFSDAFSALHAVPAGTTCYQEVAAKKLEYFNQVQTADCQNKLSRVNAAVAINDFKTALQVLSQIDANAPCFAEAKATLAAIEPKVDESLKTNYEWLLSFYKEGKAAETARWNAMTAIGLLYLTEGKKCVLVEN